MLKLRNMPFEEDIEKATDERNVGEDWAVIMHICDNATNYQEGARFCFRAILRRLHHSVPRVVLQALTLLDACVKNCDRKFLLQVASCEFTNEVRKLLPKMHPSTALKLKELIQKWSMEEFKDDPELCIIPSFYYKLLSEGVEFPPYEKNAKSPAVPLSTNPDAVNSQEEENDIIRAIEISLRDTGPPGDIPGPQESPGRESFKVRVLFDFEAAEDNELTIKAGEIAVVLDESNPSWWKGSNHRGEGLFPSNFVTKDLDREPEEPVAVSKEEVKETEKSDDSGDVEVVLDEKKIELAVDWLNDTDPTGDAPDPEEMLALEKEVYRMAPLIEEQLQVIDNRLAMLSLVNQKIMEAFDTFHSLSSLGDKYATYDPRLPQARYPTPVAVPMWPPMMRAPAPPGDQRPRSSTTTTVDSSAVDATKPRSASTEGVLPQVPVIGYYMNPGAMPFPMQQGMAAEYPSFPYAMAMMGPYFGFPSQYPVDSSAVAPPTVTPVPAPQPEPKAEPANPVAAPVPETSPKTSGYSRDLQDLSYGEAKEEEQAPPPKAEHAS